jgi:hypothetical protein
LRRSGGRTLPASRAAPITASTSPTASTIPRSSGGEPGASRSVGVIGLVVAAAPRITAHAVSP